MNFATFLKTRQAAIIVELVPGSLGGEWVAAIIASPDGYTDVDNSLFHDGRVLEASADDPMSAVNALVERILDIEE